MNRSIKIARVQDAALTGLTVRTPLGGAGNFFKKTGLGQRKICFFGFFLLLAFVFFALPLKAQGDANSYNFPSKKIAKLIANKAIEKGKTKIAVLTYQSMEKTVSTLGEIISEQIIVELVNNSSLNVVERAQVDKLLKELQFNQTGVMDAATAKKIGNGLGADVLVVGSFSMVNDSEIILFTKLVDTETFQVLGAIQESAKKNNAQAKKDTAGDKLINRRILILDFVNTRNTDEYAYLEKSIPDSFLDPLDRTKSFELLPRSIWHKYVMEARFAKEDAYKEQSAIEAGKLAGADVVIMGSFTALKDKMQIFANAIELSSGRVMVSRNASAPLSNNMFDAITKLSREMSEQMKEKLPPLPQRIIMVEREKYIADPGRGVITKEGMIWRNLVMPGWGQLYAHEWRGWVYTGLWGTGLGLFTVFLTDYFQKEQAYLTATDLLQTKYDAYAASGRLVGYSIIGIGSVYLVSILDSVIFGRNMDQVTQSIHARSDRIYAFVAPEWNIPGEGGIYAQIGYQKKF